MPKDFGEYDWDVVQPNGAWCKDSGSFSGWAFIYSMD